MPETAIVYDDVEGLDDDDLGFTCRIGNERTFIGKYVPLDGTTARHRVSAVEDGILTGSLKRNPGSTCGEATAVMASRR